MQIFFLLSLFLITIPFRPLHAQGEESAQENQNPAKSFEPNFTFDIRLGLNHLKLNSREQNAPFAGISVGYNFNAQSSLSTFIEVLGNLGDFDMPIEKPNTSRTFDKGIKGFSYGLKGRHHYEYAYLSVQLGYYSIQKRQKRIDYNWLGTKMASSTEITHFKEPFLGMGLGHKFANGTFIETDLRVLNSNYSASLGVGHIF